MSKETTHSIMGVIVYRPGVLFDCALKGPARRGKTRRDKESGAWGNRFLNRKLRGDAPKPKGGKK